MIENIIIVDSLKEAIAKLSDDVVFLGGGTEINRLGSKVKATGLVSFKFAKPEISLSKSSVKLPLGTTFQMLIDSPVVPAYLKEAAAFMGSRTKRNMATVAGNLYLHRCDSYITPVLRAAEAQIELNGEKTVGIEDYLADFDKYQRDVITFILVPVDKKIAQKRIAITVESHAVITAASNAKSAFASVKGTGQIKVDFAAVKCEGCIARELKEHHIEFKDDIYGSAEYKEYLTRAVLFDLHKEVL